MCLLPGVIGGKSLLVVEDDIISCRYFLMCRLEHHFIFFDFCYFVEYLGEISRVIDRGS